MKIIRAAHLGMCFGVRDAIALARQEAARTQVTVLGDLVHNETVLDRLRTDGVSFAREIGDVRTPSVMITAHGASRRSVQDVRDRGHHVLEATCPLVHHAHRALETLVAQGCHPVVIGQRQHVEVRGLTGDFDDFDVVLSREEIDALRPRPRFGVVAQTTQPIARVRELVDYLRQRFPEAEVHFKDTVCQPTKQRQSAAVELAKNSDVVVVIGGAHSNNTRELVQTCSRFCARVYHVQHAGDLKPEWIEGAQVVGITAGTSTPDDVIDAVEVRLREIAGWREAA
jgi:4-hydroxy-3-methylbut-2-en-1-yl diphosphate reductase